ncbi:FecR family protein [Pseudobacter ginsenosidimutans]|uniref:FecR family protein n=1 Tax=Pseudobacter ginsenosidimutans TaxID=661488 RepID=A0A4Q7MAU3_9BACT|nr:FecR family protein [Pseudobacter ginsenosidimutans]QEC42573.1 DUF4974 domain-containing protein [Pseudobacter ginsenosidimutans]RZS63938.1 FecR family protein [Pseudobacter ginsenosidimutans]
MKDLHQQKELIKRMLSGNISQEEKHQLSQLMADPAFSSLFNTLLDEQGGELVMEQDEQAQLFTNEKLDWFHQQLPVEDSEAPVFSIHRPLWKRILPYAAALITAASGLLFWWSNSAKEHNTSVAQEINKKNEYPVPVEEPVQYTEHFNQGKRRLKVKLADGSVVTIGRKGKIRYPAGFEGNTRDVYLEGEAFFEVAKDVNKPFTVFSGDVRTQVLGTSFKVSALPKSAVEVAVVTGKVRVSYHSGKIENDLATMLPGDKISWKNSRLTKLKMDPKDVLAWKHEMMVFRKQSLDDILDVFRRHYGVNITVINKGFLREKISLTLDEKMPLEKAMNVLSVTAGFDHSIDSLSRTVTIR